MIKTGEVVVGATRCEKCGNPSVQRGGEAVLCGHCAVLEKKAEMDGGNLREAGENMAARQINTSLLRNNNNG